MNLYVESKQLPEYFSMWRRIRIRQIFRLVQRSMATIFTMFLVEIAFP